MSMLKLPRVNLNCREEIEIAVSEIEIAVTLLGHRRFMTIWLNSLIRIDNRPAFHEHWLGHGVIY